MGQNAEVDEEDGGEDDEEEEEGGGGAAPPDAASAAAASAASDWPRGPNRLAWLASPEKLLCKIPFSCGITPLMAATRSQLLSSSKVIASAMLSIPVQA